MSIADNLLIIAAIAEEAIAEGGLATTGTQNAPITGFDNTNTDLAFDINPYLALSTSEHKQEKFQALLDLLTRGFYENTLLLQSFPDLFDLDYAVGNQLDIIGQWVGISRYVRVPLTSDVFSVDIPGLGFDEGYWDKSFGSQNDAMTDFDYRQVIRAKIILNNWDGSNLTAFEALNIAFPNNMIYVIDNQNMSMKLGISGTLSPVIQSLITQGYFDLRPAGVSIKYIAAPIFFSWNTVNIWESGWETGEWAHELI
jgi:hypothetical protein